MTELFWRALTLREHLWHGRDFNQRLAAIRYTSDVQAKSSAGLVADNWGGGTANVIATGPAHLFSVERSIEEQAGWLRKMSIRCTC